MGIRWLSSISYASNLTGTPFKTFELGEAGDDGLVTAVAILVALVTMVIKVMRLGGVVRVAERPGVRVR